MIIQPVDWHGGTVPGVGWALLAARGRRGCHAPAIGCHQGGDAAATAPVSTAIPAVTEGSATAAVSQRYSALMEMLTRR